MRPHRLVPCIGVLVLIACTTAPPAGDIRVDIVGTGFRTIDPDRGTLSAADAALASATTTGMVAIDGSGQVEPALAESWITTADGMSTIFRVRHARWPDGREATGDDIAASLDRALRPGSRNRLVPLTSAIDAVVGMTGRVVEIRLKVARPNLLQLLAQPEFGIRRAGNGLGPYRITQRQRSAIRLSPVPDDDRDAIVTDNVVLRSERTAMGVARFMAGQLDWLGGGTLGDLPIVRAALPLPGRLRFDPVQGLFGLAIMGRSPFLADRGIRVALSKAIDRGGLGAAVGLPGWTTTDALLPAQFDSAAPPTRPDWSGVAIGERRTSAAAVVARWAGGRRAVPVLRVALPAGSAMGPLFARLAADWRTIGVRAVRVAIDAADADLRLIDAVAPNQSANWYLTSTACAAGLVCDARGDTALLASRGADSLPERSTQIAQADRQFADRAAFIALGVPVRWSLVDPALTGWRENAFGAHPLNELRAPATN